MITSMYRFDLASYIGASRVFGGGHAAALEALIHMVKSGGWVIAGEPYRAQEPCGDYSEASGITREDLGSHFSNASRRAAGIGA